VLLLQKDSLLHGELDTANSSDLFSVRARFLSTGGGWWESHSGHQHSSITGRVPSVSQQNFATDLAGVAIDSQISALYFHHEYCQYPRDCDYYQLELPRAENPQDASTHTQDLP